MLLNSQKNWHQCLHNTPVTKHRHKTLVLKDISRKPKMPFICKASLPEGVDSLFTTAIVGASFVGLLISVVGSPPTNKVPDYKAADEDGFQWGLMGFVSCIPFVNWMAWLVPTVVGDSQSPLYYTYALLYSLPLFYSGLELDSLTISMLLLSIVHIQAERLARTEPETLKSLRPLAYLASASSQLLKATAVGLTSLLRSLADRDPGSKKKELKDGNADYAKWIEKKEGEPVIRDPRQVDFGEKQSRGELKEFDRKIKQRELRNADAKEDEE